MKKDKKKSKIEAFTDLNYIKNNFTLPTKSNPLMNVALTEYQDDPKRPAAGPAFNQLVEEDINEKTKDFVASQFKNSSGENSETNIKDRLFCDLGDNFIFNQSMRNFYATPNTTIPNDQNAFANYCYGDMISCKEGNSLACTKNNTRWINY